MTNNDYGFYGSGLDGYIHYKQSFDRTHGISSAPTRSVFDAGQGSSPNVSRSNNRNNSRNSGANVSRNSYSGETASPSEADDVHLPFLLRAFFRIIEFLAYCLVYVGGLIAAIAAALFVLKMLILLW